MMLADQGAEVIRVDPPEGPQWRHPVNDVLNRGKRSIALDLKSSADRRIAEQLVASADVLVENFRPGVMEKLGLGAREMTSLNPRLIYLSLPGFSSTDASNAQVQAWEGVVAAFCGLFSDMSANRRLYGKAPSYMALALPSADGAALGAVAVLTALYRRARTGRGETIEVPLAGAVLECTPFNSMLIEDQPPRYLTGQEAELARRQAAGQACALTYEEVSELRDPFYSRYLCSDGRPFFVCAVGNKGHIERLLNGLGLWEQLLGEGLPVNDPFTSTHEWSPESDGNSVYAYPLTGRWAARIHHLLRERFRERTSSEWSAFFAQLRVPGAADLTTAEWMASEHARAAGLIVSVGSARGAAMLQPGAVAWVDRYCDEYCQLKCAPLLDEDRDQILLEIADQALDASGRPPLASGGLDDESQPLKGLRILDFSNVIAGPTIGTSLSRFGADCIKVDRPFSAYDPGLSVMYALHCNRGKRSMLLDLTTPEGHDVSRRLIAASDVVVFNGSDRQLEMLGLDLQSLQTINPSVVLCRINAYGGPRLGPLTNLPGYDECAQSLTGMSARYGGSLETAEEISPAGTLDNLCGILGAYAVLLGLIDRALHGGAVQVGTSLTSAGQLCQLPYLYDCKDRPPFDEPSGPDAMGEHALYRLYRASDGWLFLAARREDLASLRRIPEFADLPDFELKLLSSAPDEFPATAPRNEDARLTAELGVRLKLRPVDYWARHLRPIGVEACRVLSFDEVRRTHMASGTDIEMGEVPTPLFIRDCSHPSGHAVDLVAPTGIRMLGAKLVFPGAAPKFGAHTRELLYEYGVSPEDVERLIASGTARESWGDQYLPD